MTAASAVGSVAYSLMQPGPHNRLSILCSRATPPPPSQASLCTTIPTLGVYDQYGDYIVYLSFFSGSGVTENYDIPGNQDPSNPPQEFYYLDGSDLSDCDAITQCLQIYQATVNSFPDWYSTVDVHYRISTNQWECVKYYGRGLFMNMRTSYFDQASDDIGNAYGYSNCGVSSDC